jgi:Photosynthetic reaction centre cytochrome C subunit
MKIFIAACCLFAAIFMLSASKEPKPGADGQICLSPEPGDSLALEREKFVKTVLESIKGKEKLPADSVFKNIRLEWLKKMPAERLLRIMNVGWANSLGVNCTHCHNDKDWASEEKNEKQIARDMSDMGFKISGELLKNIKNLKSERPVVNCTTCHRGQARPK